MYKIVFKQKLNDLVTKIGVAAPEIAATAKAGQFIILRPFDDSERIPLTVHDCDTANGTVYVIYQKMGRTTMELDTLNQGDNLCDIVGPLGNPTVTTGFKKVAVVGGGVGCAIAYPVAKDLAKNGTQVTCITGFRNSDLVILEDEFSKISDSFYLMTDDGSAGIKGLVTNKLEELILSGEKFDEVIAIGPILMMKFVCDLTKKYGVKTIISMNSIMIDGTGMCGGCRLTVDGQIKFACVDGPDFDGHKVDFDECMRRGSFYKDFELRERETACRLLEGKI